MDSQFYKGTTKSFRIAGLGFCIAGAGALMGFLGGWADVKFIYAIGFVLVVLGIAIGFFGVARGWVMFLFGKPDPRL